MILKFDFLLILGVGFQKTCDDGIPLLLNAASQKMKRPNKQILMISQPDLLLCLLVNMK